MSGLECCRIQVVLVKALSKTHLGTLKASLMLSQCPKIIALVLQPGKELPAHIDLAHFQMGRLEKSFQQGCLGKTSGNEKLVHNSDPGVFAGLVFYVTYSWSTHFRCFRGSSALLYSSFQGVFTPLKQTTEAERSKNLGSGYLAGSYKLRMTQKQLQFCIFCALQLISRVLEKKKGTLQETEVPLKSIFLTLLATWQPVLLSPGKDSFCSFTWPALQAGQS